MKVAIDSRLALVHKLDIMRGQELCPSAIRRIATLVVDGGFDLDDAIKAASLLLVEEHRSNGHTFKVRHIESTIRKILGYNGISA